MAKRKKLAEYLDLIKLFLDKKDLIRAKRWGEIALKKLTALASSPLDQYLLYYRLGFIYFDIQQYSLSVDNFHKAHIIASKDRFEPEYLASVSYFLALNFLALRNINLALRQYRLVEQYYQKYGYKRPQMGLSQYVIMLEGLGYCYLHHPAGAGLEKAREIIEEKIPAYRSVFDETLSSEHHHLKGEYLTRLKDYKGARLCFEEVVRLCSKTVNSLPGMLAGQMHLVILNILEGQPGSAITLLKTILREAKPLLKGHQDVLVCEALLLLSKCYALIGLQDKADVLEKRLKTILKRVDIIWFYELSKEIEQIYQRLEGNEGPVNKSSSVVTRVREHLNGQLSSYNLSQEEKQYAIIGKSEAMKDIYHLIDRVAPTNLPVLIYGETGTGKELAARAVHQRSLRSRQMWLACNTGAIPETLLESELFGYVKGAFTGAQTDKKGYIELASNGTLFLDEIGNMSLGMQQKLLRVMEDNLLWRVGSEKPIQVNTRFVLASNEDLEELVKQKRFREDLYYRINTIIITLPPLRERKEDIPLLIQHFLKKYAGKHTLSSVPNSTFRILSNYPWPGNVRELENEIKRICVLYPNAKTIDESILTESIKNYQGGPIELGVSGETGLSFKEQMKIRERIIIQEAFKKCNYNMVETARYLEYARSALYKKIKELKIDLLAHSK